MIQPEMSLREVAFVVCTELDRANQIVVLTGGSAATVYAPEAYQSRDLDFVISFLLADEPIVFDVISSLGYHREGRIFVHDNQPLTLDFVPGPLAVGQDLISSWMTLEEHEQLLHVITPTDCVRDRLAAFYHWSDRSSLAQALAVAKAQAIDISIVRDWSIREGASEKFVEFERRFNS